MKINSKSLVSFFFGIFCSSAMAYDGVITFTGKVVSQTCNVTTGSNGNFTVTLPTVSKAALANQGATAGLTPFSIDLADCTPDTDGATQVKAYFEPGASTDFTTNNLKNTARTNPASDVQIQLLNSDGASTILLGKDFAGQDVHAEAIGVDGRATLRYMARYYATGTATAGDVTTTVNYTIAYE
ncbi:TPA: fimbrial protein [Escherichia coli]|uniref:fimbrial protein n=1 Tax=Escherichia coli TaxID=562 RepID=UPI0005A90DD5|nr:fimbrial protein [Escherichia coli]EFN7202785.1 F17 fimbrial protein [Escherichia coli]EFP5573992.1 fimbrial protein [Escherichia coli]MBB8717523.1 fimbrial protein [Escherichia coli]MBS8387424.1 fimbrial protein [Escherichia coli]MBS8420199.1 fimbrial protein [Escherichia coli]